MSIKTNAHENNVLNTMRGTALAAWTPYAGLLTAAGDPETPTLTECAGTGYARVAVTFGAPSPAGTVANSADVNFPTGAADWGTITHVGINNASTAGEWRYIITLTASQTIGAGNPVKFLAGDLVISEA